jgi:hypothetical protein
LIQGNLIGTKVDGMGALGNADVGVSIFAGANSNTVGDVVAGGRNVISGNTRGVAVFDSGTAGNVVSGNYIGTNISGNAAIANSQGVALAYGSTTTSLYSIGAPPNVISGNGVGVVIGEGGIGSDANTLNNNLIGTAADGTTPLGNTGNGIRIAIGNGNFISGGTVANNGLAGIRVSDAASIGNLLVPSSVTANGGLGIDLDPAGVTANDFSDLDSGPNNLQNFPVINGAYTVSGVTTIVGSINTTPSSLIAIYVYSNLACDGTHGEGQTFNDAFVVTTDPLGNYAFTYALPTAVPVGRYITAIAANSVTNDSSEFSACRIVTADTDGDGVDNDAEVACGSNPSNGSVRPERIDGAFAGVSDDGDVDVDEALPPGAENFDCDGDGYSGQVEAGTPLCSNAINDDGGAGSPVMDDALVNDGCPVVGTFPESGVGGCANSADEADEDPGAPVVNDDTVVNDGCPAAGSAPFPGPYSEAQFKVTTSDQDPCGFTGWPSDFVSGGIPNSTNKITLGDLTSFTAIPRKFNSSPGPGSNYNQRWDLLPGRGILGNWINLNDLNALILGVSGSPPMLGRTKAFNGMLCPWAP